MNWTLLLVSIGLHLNIAIPMKDEASCLNAKAAIVRDIAGLYDRLYCVPSQSREVPPIQSAT